MDVETLGPMERLIAERACERLIIEFVRQLDLGNPSSVADLFTPDGIWEWPAGDRRIAGRDALRDYFDGRPADRLSRRMCTNILVTVTSADTAAATTYFATYRVDGYSEGMVPPRPPAQVGHYEDTFRKVDGIWLLATRTLFLSFAGPTEHLDHPGQS
ncbi:nuclear transport factor 2 family protein [Streptomyces sp. APSN-46.1]|uniref:nuclear transport factor 2 family protein n=1 Tax=Streptomyces sp. APSN-46.1 TaxID=2929049 RepID=UPI001FB49D98|nr:nuclear transport factor 2 family protein [Streptomyces sp. APSN-46.1]MCJ1679487.1 nuclear transport factor 2 family protein [Streptomyces sp. APSN-46.1]